MKVFNTFAIFFIILLTLGCSKESITGLEFNPTDHPISNISDDVVLTINTSNFLYVFTADSSKLESYSYEGENPFNFVPFVEMKMLAEMLSDTNYFAWVSMTAVTPYPKTNCNILIHGKDNDGNYLDSMCTIGSGDEASEIILELSKSVSGDAHQTLIKIANYYKK